MIDKTPHILIVDDEPSIREVLEIFFKQRGCTVTLCEDGVRAKLALSERSFTLILTDLRLPGGGGMHVLDLAKQLQPECPVVMMTAFASTATAIEAMKRGAYDYLTKPFELDALDVITQKAIDHGALLQENARLKAQLTVQRDPHFMGLIGQSREMRQVFELIERASPSTTPVLILGESGTGKEMVAQAIHQLSPRSQGPFVVINCAAIPEHLFESELFGHIRGAFTGATEQRDGLFQAADGGTLFLDEVGEMPLSMQAKVLRALQFKKVKAVGSSEELFVDIRILAATNRALSDDVRAGLFREDLYYRLNVIPLTLPPLRQRPSDIPILVEYFIKEVAQEQGREPPALEVEAMSHLVKAPLLGNVRELKNLVERALALSKGSTLTIRDFLFEPLQYPLEQEHAPPFTPLDSYVEPKKIDPIALEPKSTQPTLVSKQALCEQLVSLIASEAIQGQVTGERNWNLDEQLRIIEETFITRALNETSGNRTEAARLLGISFRSMRYRLKKLEEGDA